MIIRYATTLQLRHYCTVKTKVVFCWCTKLDACDYQHVVHDIESEVD